eukprot:COSAG06_NODE_2304_length_7115_cov_7.076660_5_plen_371_part_00
MLRVALAALGLAGAAAADSAAALDAYRHGDEQRLAPPDPAALPLWPSGAPGEKPGAIGAEYETCLTGGVAVAACKDRSIHNVTAPSITPHLVKGADSAVVVAPGGAYSILAVDREGNDIAAWLNSIGVSAFVLKYRVPARGWLPFGAAPLMDAQRAMGMVRQMASSGKVPGLNASKVGFMGFSAGSHLTGHLNVAWGERTYPHVDAADDLPCRPDFSIMVYPWESVTQAPVSARPEQASALNVTNSTPPTMLVQAEDDPVHVENALFYYCRTPPPPPLLPCCCGHCCCCCCCCCYLLMLDADAAPDALKQASASPSELHIYPSGGHGYGRCTNPGHSWHEVCTWPDRGELFLQVSHHRPQALAQPLLNVF